METSHEQRLRKCLGIEFGALLLLAFVIVQPLMQTTLAQVNQEGVPPYGDCTFNAADQAEDPVSMNTVRSGKVAKTVLTEKEIFRCFTEQGNLPLIVHVNTVAEIYENMTTRDIVLKQAEVIACAKLNATGALLGCDGYKPTTDTIPLGDCNEETYITHPQEMNTVFRGNTVKTIEAEKWVWTCNFGTSALIDDKKVEQYIIKEIWEDLRNLPDNPVEERNIESLRCVTLIDEAFVESCQFASVTGGLPEYGNCIFVASGQYEDPLSMNTIRKGDIVKTVIAEKEIFRCDLVQGGTQFITEVTTIAEIYEDIASQFVIRKDVEVITCGLFENADQGGVLGCDDYIPTTDQIPLANCNALTYLTHPQEMNTVSKGKTVKTIEIQKEVFRCNFSDGEDPEGDAFPDDKKVEQYIISEIWEDLSLLPDDPVVLEFVEGLTCVTLVDLAFVESCRYEFAPLQEFLPE